MRGLSTRWAPSGTGRNALWCRRLRPRLRIKGRRSSSSKPSSSLGTTMRSIWKDTSNPKSTFPKLRIWPLRRRLSWCMELILCHLWRSTTTSGTSCRATFNGSTTPPVKSPSNTVLVPKGLLSKTLHQGVERSIKFRKDSGTLWSLTMFWGSKDL